MEREKNINFVKRDIFELELFKDDDIIQLELDIGKIFLRIKEEKNRHHNPQRKSAVFFTLFLSFSPSLIYAFPSG